MKNLVVTSKNRIRKPVALCLLASSLLTLAGCGVWGDRVSSADAQPTGYSAISSNLLNAVRQQSGDYALPTTVQVTAPDSDFEGQVYDLMSEQGYVLETASESDAISTVSAQIKTEDNSVSELAPLYTLTVGNVTAERRFTTQGEEILPASEMVVRGGENNVLTLNDDELFGGVDDSLKIVVFEQSEQRDVLTIEEILRPASAQLPAGASAQEELEQLVRGNIYSTMQSNFGSIYNEYEDVERVVLVFPDDSMRLGQTNKEIIERYTAMMDPQTDIMSVIGCSLGPTQIKNGNAVLALGRASRVKEALMFSGVQPEKVFDEGCWAPQDSAENVMPGRGVVLTLKRSNPS